MEPLRHVMLSDGFLPHGYYYLYLWKPGLVWLHVVSDFLIAVSYLTIPLTLVYFIQAPPRQTLNTFTEKSG